MFLTVLFVLGLLSIAVVLMVRFKVTPLSWSIHRPLFQKSGVVMEFYDPVTFFSAHGPKKGVVEHTQEWNGASWFFISKENALLFKEDPTKYAPKYGGYCVKAIGAGFTGPSDVSYWTIYNHSLYLFSTERALNDFKENPEGSIEKCNKKWAFKS